MALRITLLAIILGPAFACPQSPAGFDRGDVLRYDLAASFRVLPWVYDTYPDHQINLTAEVNGAWTERARLGGVESADSGGHIVFVSPGVQYMYDAILVEASVQIPIPGATSLNGTQLAPDWTALAGVRWLIY